MKSLKRVIDKANLELEKLLITKDGHPLPQNHESISRNWLQAVTKATNKEG